MSPRCARIRSAFVQRKAKQRTAAVSGVYASFGEEVGHAGRLLQRLLGDWPDAGTK